MATNSGVTGFKIGADDYIEGIVNPSIRRVQINYNNQYLAIVPTVTPKDEDKEVPNPETTFTCQLPSLSSVGDGWVEIFNPDDGTRLGVFPVFGRKPLVNGYGLLATEVQKYKHSSYTTSPWVMFDGVTLTIKGNHLPPMGDPDRVMLNIDPGVSYTFTYPEIAEAHKRHFWYWPNAIHCGFTLKINLAASRVDSNPFLFSLVDRKDPSAEVKWMRFPTDLRLFMDFPQNLDQLGRVQSRDLRIVATTGYQDFWTFEELLFANGLQRSDQVSLLDWGCGHGRLTRHFIREWPKAEVWGADIDADNISWAKAHLTNGHFAVLPLMPPSPLPDQHFDAIMGLSVMTHLTAEVQAKWIKELSRCLKPKGLALLTFNTERVVAYSSVFRTPEWWRNFAQNSFDDGQMDPALDGQIEDKTYYRLTHQTEQDMRQRWSSDFEVLQVIHDAFGCQSVAVLRKL